MVIHLLRMAGETCLPLRLIQLPMGGVAVETVLMFTELVQARKNGFLVAGAAIGREIDRLRSVRSVAAGTVAGDLPMGRLGIATMTIGAARAIRLIRMWLMTVGTLCVPLGSKSMLLGVTRFARDH